MYVVKSSGKKEKYKRAKIIASLEKVGAKGIAGLIADRVERRIGKRKEVSCVELRELVISELQQESEKTAADYARLEHSVRDFSKREDNLENRIIELVGAHGELEDIYGGFSIVVKSEDYFDFAGVLRELLSANQFVRIELTGDGKIRIATE